MPACHLLSHYRNLDGGRILPQLLRFPGPLMSCLFDGLVPPGTEEGSQRGLRLNPTWGPWVTQGLSWPISRSRCVLSTTPDLPEGGAGWENRTQPPGVQSWGSDRLGTLLCCSLSGTGSTWRSCGSIEGDNDSPHCPRTGEESMTNGEGCSRQKNGPLRDIHVLMPRT